MSLQRLAKSGIPTPNCRGHVYWLQDVGDDIYVGAVCVLCALQESNGDVLRLPVMSKKMMMAGELEITGSLAAPAPQAPQVCSGWLRLYSEHAFGCVCAVCMRFCPTQGHWLHPHRPLKCC
jgi:hypothetical protein